jgi:hypothetical protein
MNGLELLVIGTMAITFITLIYLVFSIGVFYGEERAYEEIYGDAERHHAVVKFFKRIRGGAKENTGIKI